MHEKNKNSKGKSLSKRREELIKELWGNELDKWNIWNRKKHKGYSTVPRTLNYINRIIDCLSGTGVPVSQTYLSLWCRVFDEGFVEIRDKNDIAYESGFSGQRAVTTWLSRMKKLRELGFIKTKGGTSGEFQYVLMMNPLYVIKQIYDSGRLTKDERYMALFSRMKEVGAKWE